MAEAATGGVLWKKVFLKISQNSQENTCAGVSLLIKLQASSNFFYRATPGDCFRNADIAKTKQEKKIVFVVERWMQCFLLQLKSQRTREACRYPIFMDICPTISHTCEPYLPSRWVRLLVLGVAELCNETGLIWGFTFLFLVLIRRNEEGRWVQDFLLSPQGFESFHSDLPRLRWRDLCVDCLQMIKSMVVGFRFIGS